MFNKHPKVYFAGKIGLFDWRHDLVPGLRDQEIGRPLDCKRFVYAGPFFVTCGHCGEYEPRMHGLAESEELPAAAKWTIPGLCFNWIKSADILFAWIDDATCHGTLVEIGWAQVLGKPVYLAFSCEQVARELWFAGHGPRTRVGMHCELQAALEAALDHCRESY